MRAHDDERLARAAAELAPSRGSAGGACARRPPFLLSTGVVSRLGIFSRVGLASLGSLSWLAIAALGCAEFTSPPSDRSASEGGAPSEPAVAPPPGGAAPSADTRVVAERVAPAAAADAPAQIEASHILVSYQGATRAKPTVTRTREEARALATQLAARAREPGTDFAALARDVSDGPSGVEGGVLPRFGRQQMVKPFSDAAFALRPGEISGVVETNFGFHVIQRTQ